MSTPVVSAKLPRMTNPLGRHWGQPADLRERVRIFATHATIDDAAWRELPRYESTLPSGTYTGKVWRCGPWLCWYGRESEKTIRIGRARALVQGPGTNITRRATS